MMVSQSDPQTRKTLDESSFFILSIRQPQQSSTNRGAANSDVVQ